MSHRCLARAAQQWGTEPWSKRVTSKRVTGEEDDPRDFRDPQLCTRGHSPGGDEADTKRMDLH